MLTVPDKFLKCRDPRFNDSGEIRPKAIGCSIFDRFSNFNKWQSEAAGDVISGVALENVGADVLARYGDWVKQWTS